MSQPADPNQPHRPYPRVVAYPAKPRRHRPANPHEQANQLALLHQDIADKVARNLSKRTGHPVDDLRQIAMLGIIQASRRYDPKRGSFRAFARTYANGEVYHFLRDKGFMLRLPAAWRELHARYRSMNTEGASIDEIARRLGITKKLLLEIQIACSLKVVSLEASGEHD
jgi:DNA-directed RNA polymerase specialized sigma subunit